jgi:hypothetical protein
MSELASLGQRHDVCGVNQPKRTTLVCSQMSGDHFDSGVIKFDGG